MQDSARGMGEQRLIPRLIPLKQLHSGFDPQDLPRFDEILKKARSLPEAQDGLSPLNEANPDRLVRLISDVAAKFGHVLVIEFALISERNGRELHEESRQPVGGTQFFVSILGFRLPDAESLQPAYSKALLAMRNKDPKELIVTDARLYNSKGSETPPGAILVPAPSDRGSGKIGDQEIKFSQEIKFGTTECRYDFQEQSQKTDLAALCEQFRNYFLAESRALSKNEEVVSRLAQSTLLVVPFHRPEFRWREESPAFLRNGPGGCLFLFLQMQPRGGPDDIQRLAGELHALLAAMSFREAKVGETIREAERANTIQQSLSWAHEVTNYSKSICEHLTYGRSSLARAGVRILQLTTKATQLGFETLGGVDHNIMFHLPRASGEDIVEYCLQYLLHYHKGANFCLVWKDPPNNRWKNILDTGPDRKVPWYIIGTLALLREVIQNIRASPGLSDEEVRVEYSVKHEDNSVFTTIKQIALQKTANIPLSEGIDKANVLFGKGGLGIGHIKQKKPGCDKKPGCGPKEERYIVTREWVICQNFAPDTEA